MGCDIISQTKSESCRQQSTSRKVSIHNSGKLNYAKQMERSVEKRAINNSGEEVVKGSETFASLTIDETLLIARSSEEIKRLPIESKSRYREIVKQLMKNTGVVFSEESMKHQDSKGIDNKQRGLFKAKVIPDFRRQTTQKMDCSLEGCNERN